MIKHLSHYWFPLLVCMCVRLWVLVSDGKSWGGGERLKRTETEDEKEQTESEGQKGKGKQNAPQRWHKNANRKKEDRQGLSKCVYVKGGVSVCVRGKKSSFITSKLRTDSIICRNHMEITSHCSSWSTKFGSNRIGGIGGAIYLEGERASQALYAYMYVCVREKENSFILQRNEQGNENALGGDQIITHLGSETERDFTNATLWKAPLHTHTYTQMYNVSM